jgi:hypothetical protein
MNLAEFDEPQETESQALARAIAAEQQEMDA